MVPVPAIHRDGQFPAAAAGGYIGAKDERRLAGRPSTCLGFPDFVTHLFVRGRRCEDSNR